MSKSKLELEIVMRFRNDWKYSLKEIPEEEIIETAINNAYAPSMRRAIKLNGKSSKEPREECAKFMRSNIAEKYKTINDARSFDDFAKACCDNIVNIFHDKYGIEDYTYGNAQKWLNMTFKYMLSANNMDYNLKVFEVCHIPIDRIIMDIAKDKLSVEPLSCAWSNCNDWKEIQRYQDSIRNAVEIPPLLWEIKNWKNWNK